MNIFCNLTGNDSVAVLLWLAGAWLLGLLLGRMLWGSKVAALKASLDSANASLDPLKAELEMSKASIDLKAADLSKANLAIEEQRNLLRGLEDEKSKLHGELYDSKEQLSKSQAENEANLALLAAGGTAAATQILDNDQDELDAMQHDYLEVQKRVADLEATNSVLTSEINELKARDVNSVEIEAAEDVSGELAAIKNAYKELQNDNENLRGELAAFKGDTASSEPAGVPFEIAELDAMPMGFTANKSNAIPLEVNEPFVDETPIEATPEEVVAEEAVVTEETPIAPVETDEAEPIVEIDAEPIVEADAAPSDVRINAIKSAAPVAMIVPVGMKLDDLKAIEGIGPKISGLLMDAGINTWQELADTKTDRLREILENAGSRYSIHNPESWPTQARLLADGKWDEFKAYTDYLVGGRDIDAKG